MAVNEFGSGYNSFGTRFDKQFLPILKKLNKIHKEMDEKDVQSEEKAKGGV